MKSVIIVVAKHNFENALRRAFFESLGISDAACDCMTSARDNEQYFDLVKNNAPGLSDDRNAAQLKLAKEGTKFDEIQSHRLTIFSIESDEEGLDEYVTILLSNSAKRIEEGRRDLGECKSPTKDNNYAVMYVETDDRSARVRMCEPEDLSHSSCEHRYSGLRAASHRGAVGVAQYIFNCIQQDPNCNIKTIVS